jgi:hypothetical protein
LVFVLFLFSILDFFELCFISQQKWL